MPSKNRELGQGLKLIAIAVMSAGLTATLVIGAGQAILRGSEPAAPPETLALR